MSQKICDNLFSVEVVRPECHVRVENTPPAWPWWRCALHSASERVVDAMYLALVVICFSFVIGRLF